MIQNIPYADRKHSLLQTDKELLQLLPSSDPLAVHKLDVAHDTATSITLTGKQLIHVKARDYGVFIRRTTATDTSACTSANWHHALDPGDTGTFGLKEGATGLSLIGEEGTAKVKIAEY